MVSFGAALQKVLRKFAVASTPRTQAEIQRVTSGFATEWGQPITNDVITKALKRIPVAHRIVFAVAHDIFDNWFEVEPLEEGGDKEKFNEQVQKVLLLLNAMDVFTFSGKPVSPVRGKLRRKRKCKFYYGFLCLLLEILKSFTD